MRLWALSIQPALNCLFSAISEEISGFVRLAASSRPGRAVVQASELCGDYVLVAAYFDYECAKEAIAVQQKF